MEIDVLRSLFPYISLNMVLGLTCSSSRHASMLFLQAITF
jgi:hypothetical protein